MGLTEEDIRWIEKHEQIIKDGESIVAKASNEALDYLRDVYENINDRAWRKMVMEKHALDIGVGIAIVEHLVPNIYKDMEKSMHRKLKLDKELAKSLRQIYIGRVIKNIKEELNAERK